MILDRQPPPAVASGPRSSKLAGGSRCELSVLRLPRIRGKRNPAKTRFKSGEPMARAATRMEGSNTRTGCAGRRRVAATAGPGGHRRHRPRAGEGGRAHQVASAVGYGLVMSARLSIRFTSDLQARSLRTDGSWRAPAEAAPPGPDAATPGTRRRGDKRGGPTASPEEAARQVHGCQGTDAAWCW
jgi:hypothetical protein